MSVTLDHHVLAGILLSGQILDLLGGLYLAYDLFGGHQGPLRRMTEIISYLVAATCVTGTGYLSFFLIIGDFNPSIIHLFGETALKGAALGLGVGGGVGGGLGYAINVPTQRVYRLRSRVRLLSHGILIGLVTGLIGCAGWLGAVAFAGGKDTPFIGALTAGILFNMVNCFIFGALVARLLVARHKDADEAPTIDRLGGLAGMLAGLLIGSIVGAGYQWVFRSDLLSTLLTTLAGGLIAGVGLGLFVATIRTLEWRIETLPPRRMGVFGVILILIGFVVQSLQYLVALFDISVR